MFHVLKNGINSDTICSMKDVLEIVRAMRNNPKSVRFDDLCKVCEHYFGKPRQKGSHVMYKTPWQGDPRINLQDSKGTAKAYQVRQVIEAINRLEQSDENID